MSEKKYLIVYSFVNLTELNKEVEKNEKNGYVRYEGVIIKDNENGHHYIQMMIK